MDGLRLIKIILGIFYLLASTALVVLVLLQRSKEDGLSGAITGQTMESFYAKSKGSMSKEKFQVRLTIVLSVTFAVVAIIQSALMRSGT